VNSYLSEDASLIFSFLPEGVLPPEDSDSLFILYAVLMRVKGVDVSASDVHDAWSAWMLINGKSHQALIPFDGLSAEIKREDDPYVTAIRDAARAKRSLSAKTSSNRSVGPGPARRGRMPGPTDPAAERAGLKP